MRAGARRACAVRGAEADAAAGAHAFRQTAAEPYAASVQDVELLAGGRTAVVALRDTCRLRLYGLAERAETGQVNLNPLGDEHVGFVATQLALSPGGAMLAVSTDGPRILVLRVAGARGRAPCARPEIAAGACPARGAVRAAGTSARWRPGHAAALTAGPRAGWEQLRNICGLTVEPFHQAAALWHRSGFYLMAAAAAGQVFVFHVGSGKARAASRDALLVRARLRGCRRCCAPTLKAFPSW